MINVTPSQLRHAADIKERIDALQVELHKLLGGVSPTSSDQSTVPELPEQPKKRKISAAGLARMRAGAKARWAKVEGKSAGDSVPAKPAKRKLSAQGLANIRAGVLKRMAAKGKALAAKPEQKVRKKISAAGLANIRAAQKARWAKTRAAAKSRL